MSLQFALKLILSTLSGRHSVIQFVLKYIRFYFRDSMCYHLSSTDAKICCGLTVFCMADETLGTKESLLPTLLHSLTDYVCFSCGTRAKINLNFNVNITLYSLSEISLANAHFFVPEVRSSCHHTAGRTWRTAVQIEEAFPLIKSKRNQLAIASLLGRNMWHWLCQSHGIF